MWPDDFSDWYEWAYPQVYRAVQRFLRRQGLHDGRAADLAEEAAQEAARRAATRTGSPGYFESRDHFRNWMMAVARNYASDRLDAEHAGQLPEGHDEPHRPSSREEFFASVWSCFAQLSEQDQQLLDWYYWDRLGDREIGEILFASTRELEMPVDSAPAGFDSWHRHVSDSASCCLASIP